MSTQATAPDRQTPPKVDELGSGPTRDWLRIWAWVALAVAVAGALGVTYGRTIPATNDWSAPTGDLVFDLCLAYIGAWIFNLIIVEWPRRRDRQQLQLALNPMLRRLIGIGQALQHTLEAAAERPVAQRSEAGKPYEAKTAFPASACQVREWCDNIPFEDGSGMLMTNTRTLITTPLGWEDYLASLSRQARAARGEVAALYAILDPDLIAAVAAERTAKFHQSITPHLIHVIGMENLDWCADEFAEYIQVCAALQRFVR